jgi:FAD/FMN-containing dehydrogenase
MADLIASLRAGVGGAVSRSAAELAAYSHDFGGQERRAPLAVVRAGCEEDVAHTLRVARAYRVPVGVRGAGHSCGGQSTCAGGVLIVNRAEVPQLRLLGDDRVEVSARTTWAQLEVALNGRGRSAPVLTNHLETTVGGTLATGGYGPRSIIHGAQVDQVERLRLIRPDGTAVWCSAAEHPELFRLSLTGFGQIGVIESAVLRTVPRRPLLRVQVNEYRSLPELLGAIAWTADWSEPSPDHFCAELEGGQVRSLCGSGFGRRFDALASPVPPPLRAMSGGRERIVKTLVVAPPTPGETAHDPRYRHLWADYCLDLDGLRAFVRFVDTGLRDGRLARNLSRIYLLCLRRRSGGPEWPFDVRAIGGPGRNLYGIGLYYRVDRADRAGVDACQAALRSALETCLELGGRPYLYGWHELDRDSKRKLYGRDYDRLLELRRQLDPHGLLNAGAL